MSKGMGPKWIWVPKTNPWFVLQAKVSENNPANSPENSPTNSQLWYVDGGCSRHMMGEKSNFLSLVASNGGSVAFENDKSGTIISIGKIGESLSLVDGLQHNLLSLSQLCNKDNLVVFSAKQWLVFNINTGDVVLRGKRHKNVHKVCISSLPQNNLTCLSALNDDVML